MHDGQAAHYARLYYRERLEDPSLLDRAIPAHGSFAVPCGGKRRSGSVTTSMEVAADLLEEMLHRPAEFPEPRMETGATQFVAIVEWGEEVFAGTSSEAERGRMYGYSETAIGAYLAMLRGEVPPIPRA